jgi:hypothetical protein
VWAIAWPIVRAVLIARGLEHIVDSIERAVSGAISAPETIPQTRSETSSRDSDDSSPDTAYADDPLAEELAYQRATTEIRTRARHCPSEPCGRSNRRRHRSVYTCD